MCYLFSAHTLQVVKLWHQLMGPTNTTELRELWHFVSCTFSNSYSKLFCYLKFLVVCFIETLTGGLRCEWCFYLATAVFWGDSVYSEQIFSFKPGTYMKMFIFNKLTESTDISQVLDHIDQRKTRYQKNSVKIGIYGSLKCLILDHDLLFWGWDSLFKYSFMT